MMKCQSVGLGLAAALFATASPAVAQPWTVFGLELGKPVALPECKHTVLPDGRLSKYTYELDPAVICHEPDIQLSDAPWRRGSVNFPLKQSPLILHVNSGYTHIVDGKLEGLKLETLGYANANAIISELKAKFGEPTWSGETTSTVSGVAVPAVEAEWELPELYVSYISIGPDIDYGALLIETPVMRAVRAAHEQQQAEQRTPL